MNNKSKMFSFQSTWLRNVFIVATLISSHPVFANSMIFEESTSIIKHSGNTLYVEQDTESFRIQSGKGNYFKISALKSNPKLSEADVVRIEINNSTEDYKVRDIVNEQVFVKESTYKAYWEMVNTDIGEFLKLKENSSILFGVGWFEGLGCGAAGLVVGAANPAVGAGALAVCLAIFNSGSIETD